MRNSGGDSDRDHVKLLDYYISKVPKDVIERNERFYLRALTVVPKLEDVPWFARQCIGQHKLQKMVKTMFKDAKIDGNFTNHSLRATGATALFNAGVPEAVIQKRTGHKSSDALQLYERVNDDQLQAVSNILGSTSSTKSTYNEALKESFSKKSEKRVETAQEEQNKSLPPAVFANCVFNSCTFPRQSLLTQPLTSPAFSFTQSEIEELVSPF